MRQFIVWRGHLILRAVLVIPSPFLWCCQITTRLSGSFPSLRLMRMVLSNQAPVPKIYQQSLRDISWEGDGELACVCQLSLQCAPLHMEKDKTDWPHFQTAERKWTSVEKMLRHRQQFWGILQRCLPLLHYGKCYVEILNWLRISCQWIQSIPDHFMGGMHLLLLVFSGLQGKLWFYLYALVWLDNPKDLQAAQT